MNRTVLVSWLLLENVYFLQIFGRSGSFAIQRLSGYVERVHGGKIDSELRSALIAIQERMERHIPRTLTGGIRPVFHIYTDAYYDATGGGLGGVLVDESGTPLSFFRRQFNPFELARVNCKNGETIIGELEALAMLLGLLTFGKGLEEHELVVFGDNEGAVRSFMRMKSESRQGIVEGCNEVSVDLHDLLQHVLALL